ncbi:putative P-loop containing nucleoside triphosphate hydrolase, Clp domain superfamily [Helianthus annuus]|nr:putative P-loop containing nucleoside triphosphate hydrolase, Clp domain superfamily [Helianthus annuus]
MRAEGYTIQHSLSSEAAAIVKQAFGLAKRRGHAQVTPLHVASALSTSSTSLFRKACLQINTHPLQCQALELCFNVALNRLPISQSIPIMLSPNQSNNLCLSNALVAAFKRALAHQRRGSVENQQQPVLALRVEIEQLIMSILDDPSVCRVMRGAGFSSTQIKNRIEQMVSLEISSQTKENIKPILQDFQISFGNKQKFSPRVRDEDVMSVIDTMMERRKKSIVVIRECLVSADDIVRGVIDIFERGNIMVFSGNLKFVQFVSLPLHALSDHSREEIEDKVKELRCLLKSHVKRGVILYLGDLKWVSDYWSKYSEQRLRTYYYSPMEHMIMELSRLMFGYGDSGKFWLMGIANSETYLSCKSGRPSLETLWDLFPHTTPVGGLDLTLNLDSKDSPNETKQLACCGECSINFTREAQSMSKYSQNNESITTNKTSTLPLWLQQCKEKNSRQITINDQECDRVGRLHKKWSSICCSLHKQPHFLDNAFHLCSPSTKLSASSHKYHHKSPILADPKNIPKEHQFFTFQIDSDGGFDDHNLRQTSAVKPNLLSHLNSSPNSASCSEVKDADECFMHKFKEVNSKNIRILTNALEKKVPRQRMIIPEIVSTVLQCRSGLTKRKGKEDTWLFFLGSDIQGKEMISRELATVVFGSTNNFIPIGLSCFSSTKHHSMVDGQDVISCKRERDEHGQSYIENFAAAVEENASRVFFLEEVDQVDYQSQMGIKKAIESGRITKDCGKSIHLKDAIVILNCESFTSFSIAMSPIRRSHSERQFGMFDLNRHAQDTGILNSVDKQVKFNI